MNSVIEDLYNSNLFLCEHSKSILQHYYEKKEEAFQGYKSFIKKIRQQKRKRV